MCERCVQKEKNLEERAEYIDKRISAAHDLLNGIYDEGTQETMDADPFDKEFAEKLFQIAAAAQQLALAFGAIVDMYPSLVLGEWAGIVLESEIEMGQMGALAQLVNQRNQAQEVVQGLFGRTMMDTNEDEPTTLH